MGIRLRGKWFQFRFKGPDGNWVLERSEYQAHQEREAQKAFDELVDRIAAGVDVIGQRKDALTMKEYAELKWFGTRRGVIVSAEADEQRLANHVFPAIGAMRLDDIRARHVAELFRAMRTRKVNFKRKTTAKAPAPKTIYNIYSVVCALFRDAEIDGLIDKTPCILTKTQLGANVDADPEWRAGAVFKREEVEALISDARIPLDCRVFYALKGVAATRHSEAARLRFRHYDESAEVLGRMMVVDTKTKVTKYMPVHPVLAALLAEWKLSGWAQMMGRVPGPDDFLVPTPPGGRIPAGQMRTANWAGKRLREHLELLGLRHRTGHNLRRTMISLARSDGAVRDILRRGTHKPPKEVIEGYTTFEWDVLCREVSKLNLKLQSPMRRQLLVMGTGRGSAENQPANPYPENARSLEARYRLVTDSGQPPATIHETPARSRGLEPPYGDARSDGIRSNASPNSAEVKGLPTLPPLEAGGSDGSNRYRCNEVTSSILESRRAVLARLADPEAAKARAEILATLPPLEWTP